MADSDFSADVTGFGFELLTFVGQPALAAGL